LDAAEKAVGRLVAKELAIIHDEGYASTFADPNIAILPRKKDRKKSCRGSPQGWLRMTVGDTHPC